jgi:hypothetical protein
MVVASGRIKSSPRVKLRLLLPIMMVIVGSSACARAGGSKKQTKIRARTMARARSPNDMTLNKKLSLKSRVRIALELVS